MKTKSLLPFMPFEALKFNLWTGIYPGFQSREVLTEPNESVIISRSKPFRVSIWNQRFWCILDFKKEAFGAI